MNPKRILIVDDEPNLSQMTQLSLERTGAYEVKTESRGLRAIQTALDFKPHLFLLDYCLLDTDGGTVADKILAHPELKHIPIIFMTSLLSPQESENGMKLNGDIPILPKPCETPKLIERIESLLPDR